MKIEPKPTTDTSEKEEFLAKIVILVFLVMVLAITSFFVFMVLSDRNSEDESIELSRLER